MTKASDADFSGALGAAASSGFDHVWRTFALIQGREPDSETVARASGRSARETLIRRVKSPRFAEQALESFLRGVDSDELRERFKLTEEVVACESARLCGDAPPAASSEGERVLLSWRRAFFLFWSNLGEVGAPLLEWVSRSSEAGARNAAAFAEALVRLAEIDDLVTRGAFARAFLEARRGVEEGLTCFASRHLVLGCGLCVEPDAAAQILAEAEPVCSRRLMEAMRRRLEAQVEAELGETDGSASSEIESLAALEGELPAVYALALAPLQGPRAFGEAVTLWSAVGRPGVLPPRPADATGAPRLAMAVGDASAAEVAAAAERLVAEGVRVLLITSDGPDRDALKALDGVDLAGGFAEARRLAAEDGDEGPLLVLDRFAPLPWEAFEALRAAVPPEAVLAAAVETAPFAFDRPVLSAAAARESALAGVFAPRAPFGWAALEAAEDRPAAAAAAAPAAGPPVRFVRTVLTAEPEPEEMILLELGPAPEGFGPRRGGERLRLPGNATGAEAARALRAAAAERGWSSDAPVVPLAANFLYDPRYPSEIALRYERLGRRAPIAARGVRVDPDTGAAAFVKADLSGGLFRCAPAALSCLGLEAACAAFEAEAEAPAAEALATFAPPAVAWPEGSGLTGGTQAHLLEHLDAAPERAQRVFERGRSDAAEEIRATRAAIGHLPPYMAYLQKQEAVRRRFADARRGEPLEPLRAAIAGGGVETLFDDGCGDEVREFLEALAPKLDRLIELEAAGFRTLFRYARRCGLQELYARALAPLAPAICAADLYKIRILFDFLAGSADAEVFFGALVAATVGEARGPGRTPHLQRLLLNAARYGSATTAAALLREVDATRSEALARGGEALAEIGARMLAAPALDLRLPKSGLTADDLRACAPAEQRLAQAAVAGDRGRLVEALREIGDRDGGVRAARRSLHFLTEEAARLAVTSRDWFYPGLANAEETLTMAATLGDAEEIRARLPQVEDPELRAAAARALGEPGPLEMLYAAWAEAEGVVPLSFAGGSILELFDGILSTSAPVSAAAGADAPLVSVVVTSFNAPPELLRRALDSVLGQSWRNVEILLVDDRSAPAARVEAEALAARDPRVVFLETGRNSGPYVGRNLALRRARGAFVAIQDADDVSHPERLARQVARLRTSPAAAACASSHLRFDAGARLQLQGDRGIRGDGTMSTMFRREVFDRLGPFTETRSRGDVEYRERIRKAFGPAAFRQTACPLVFCYGAPSTLSNVVVLEGRDALQQFRMGFTQLRWGRGSEPRPLGPLATPFMLRP